MKALFPLAAACLGSLLNVHAACPSESDAAAMAERFARLEPVPNPPSDLTVSDAFCGRARFTAILGRSYGRVVGYKAGLTNPAVQQRFNYPSPVRGTLFEKMLLQDGAEVPAKFGARPVFEADIIVEVKDAGINDATTPLAARLGVLGKPIEVKASQALVDALAGMTVRLVDHDGMELETAKGTAILEQPLNVVLWLVKDLNDGGIALKKGDLLSLGSFSRLLPPQPGTGAKVTYEGLPGNPSVSVRFK